MTDCFGLCRLFEREHSSGKMGNDLPKPNENYVVVPTGDNMIRRSPNTTDMGPLNLEWINYCFVKNGQKHRTDKYYCMYERNPTLVVRRGLPICFYLKFDREFDMANDSVSFMFKLAETGDANFGNNTMAAVPLKENPSNGNGHWSAYVMSTDDVDPHVVSVRITPPNNCIVGQWIFDIDTRFGQEAAMFSAKGNPIYILFNPWCPTDEVYIKDDELREEYVLSEEGLMWRGSHSRQKEVMWKYGQFQKNMLESSFLLLLKIRRLALIHCSDPIKVSRSLSAAVNAPDELGVVQGNWTEDFSGGTAPINWLGSVDIINQFIKTKKPVKYGQCWVYAGVLTTVCRAIGIPCRPVTAYCAAHDTQNSLTIDYLVDDDGKIIEELQTDSIWNYHVWNEVWMARPDLNILDRSWQVIDATPQELSEGQFKCGPASVTAVKNGDIRAPYDTAFVYSEVNADKVYWRYYGISQPMKLLRKDTEAIGKLICTKAAGKWEQENITDNYKYPEKSTEERITMHKALKQNNSIFSRYYLNEDFNEIKFDFELVDDIIVGENFRVAVRITNKGHKDYTVKVILRVDTVDYTGKNGSLVTKVEQQKVVLHDPGSNVEFVQTALTYFDYGNDVKSQNVFNISCLASVVDTDYEYFGQDDFRVRKPDIEFEMHDKPAMSREVRATVKFRNPLPLSLKDGKFFIAGSSLPKTLEIKVGKVSAKKTTSVSFKFTPQFTGKQVISAKFTSKQLQDVDGYLQFMV